MQLSEEMLLERFRQCHEHLRETDRKRDILLGGYVTLSAAFLAFAGGDRADISMVVGGAIALVFVGLVLIALFTIYRAWHVLYVLQAIRLQQMHLPSLEQRRVGTIAFRFAAFGSVEFLMFCLLCLVVLSVALLGLWEARCLAGGNWLSRILIAGAAADCLGPVAHHCAMLYLDSLKKRERIPANWLWFLQV